MNSPKQPPVEPRDQFTAEEVEPDTQVEIPAFKFPFKPGELTGAKRTGQPWYKNGAKNGHTKVPGMAPPGTRRSMGKR